MMRLGDVEALAERDGLLILTIADLIAWRREHDPVSETETAAGTGDGFSAHVPRVRATTEAFLPTAHGHFRIHGYRDLRTGAEHVALVPANPPLEPGATPVVRVHSECLTGDAFGSLRCDCGPQLHAAMETVTREGGAVVYLRGHEGRGIGLLAKVHAYALQDAGLDTVQANLELGWPVDRREYGAAAAILADLGLGRVELLTNNPAKVSGLTASGIDVASTRRLEVGRSVYNDAYLRTKKTQMGHLLDIVTDSSDNDTSDHTEERA
jgi:3,4-dihydroxy 2-butanone 4-phosphate synthase/GTP cyclohydrolase II